MKKIPFHFQILIGMAAGLLVGYLLPEQVPYITPLGQIFIKLLKLVVIPLIFVSIVDGIARVGSTERLSTLGGKTIAYYIGTNAVAVVIGLTLVNLIKPGVGVSVFGAESPNKEVAVTSLFDFIPSNIVQAMAEGRSLQIIFVAIFMGIGLVTLQNKTANLRNWFGEVSELLLKLTQYIIALAPIGVFSLMAGLTQALDWNTFVGIGKFSATIIIALFIHGVIVIPLIFKLFSERSLLDYFKSLQPALLTAFSTSSSSATLPLTLECVEKNAKVPKEVAGFVLPIGATVNMDGTAIYEATACLFVAQAVGMDLSLMQQLTVFFTASLAAMGAAAIPSAGLITLTLVLNAVGLPLEGIGLLLAIDRPLDMSRTVVNVWGDAVGCVVVEGKGKNLEKS